MIEYARFKREQCVISRLQSHGLVLALALFFIVGLISLAKADEPLTFAASKSGWIVWIAEERGLFKEHDVDIKIELVTSGLSGAEGLISGRFDLATMSEYAFVRNSFTETDLRLIGTVGAISNVRLIGRRDLGVIDVTNLVGKRVGLLKGAISQFFMAQLMDINGIDPASVTVIDYRPTGLPNALKTGEVDAIVSWEPYGKQARIATGNNAVELDIQGEQSYYFTIATKQKTIESNEENLKGVIAALVEAADWAALNETAAQKILHQKLGFTYKDLQEFWPNHIMDVTLTQDMVFLMSDEAIWRSDTGLSSGNVPEILDLIYYDALEAVDPSRIGVIR